MISFVKELDEKTTRLARELAGNRAKLDAKYRVLTLAIVWVGGDKEKMEAWSQKNGLNELLIGVTPADDETLKPWRLDPKAHNTTVVMLRTTPKAKFIDLDSRDLPKLQAQMDVHFLRYKRK